jgi:hypothetical protein
MKKIKDNPYVRVIHIPHTDKERLNDIIKNIPRVGIVRETWHFGTMSGYVVRMKKEELLLIKLSFKDVSIRKVRKTKRNPCADILL